MISTSYRDASVTQLRGLSWLALDETGRVVALTSTSDSGGDAVGSWTTGSNVACRVDPLSNQSGEFADQVNERSTHLITLPPGTVAVTSSRFQVDGWGTFEITAVRARTEEHVRELEAVKA